MQLKLEASNETPVSKRGVVRTEVVEAQFDALSVTISEDFPRSLIQDVFCPMTRWQDRSFGTRGYQQSATCGSITMSWGGSPGVHVSMQAKGCRQLEAQSDFSWEVLFEQLQKMAARFTRIDVAFDDRYGYLSLEVMERSIRDKHLTTRAEKRRKEDSWTDTGEDRPGTTLYLGRRASTTFCRIYDKAAEQKEEGHWIRVELELKKHQASAAVDTFLEGGFRALNGFLRAYLDFKEPQADTNRRRWPTVAWWEAFLQGVAKCGPSLHKVATTLEIKARWLLDQVATSLSMVVEHMEGDLDFVLRMVFEGGRRKTSEHERILKEASIRGVNLNQVLRI